CMRWTVSILLSLLLSVPTAFARTDLLDTVLETRQNITERLGDCGLTEVAAHHPSLPRPRVPAHRAYIDSERDWMPGYHYRAGQAFRWIRPNGAAVAWMTLEADEEIG